MNETQINWKLDTAEERTRKLKNRLKGKFQITAQKGKKMENIKEKLRNIEKSLRRNKINIFRVQGGQNVKNGEKY